MNHTAKVDPSPSDAMDDDVMSEMEVTDTEARHF